MSTNLLSGTVAGSSDATALQYNNLRKDVILNAGDYETAGGTADVLTLAIDAQYVAYAAGDVIRFQASAENTGVVTINVNSLGAKSVKIKNSDTATLEELEAGDIISGQEIVLQYDGTDFQLMSNTPKSTERLRKQFTAGENITAGEAVIIGDGTSTAEQIAQDTEDAQDGLTTTAYRFSQSFTTGATTEQIEAVQLRISKSGTNGPATIQVDIYLADGSDEPTGGSLASQTVVLNPSAGLSWRVFTFASPLSVLTATKYVLVLKVNSFTGGDEVLQKYWSAASVYSGGLSKKSTDSGTSWSAHNYDLMFRVDMLVDITESGKVYLSDASVDNALANNFIGFADETITSGNPGKITIGGIDDNQTGLSTGSKYYLSDTLGAIASSAGSQSRFVGRAVSATEIKIINDF